MVFWNQIVEKEKKRERERYCVFTSSSWWRVGTREIHCFCGLLGAAESGPFQSLIAETVNSFSATGATATQRMPGLCCLPCFVGGWKPTGDDGRKKPGYVRRDRTSGRNTDFQSSAIGNCNLSIF